MPSGWNNSSLLTAHFSLKKIFLRRKISEKEENEGMIAIKKFKNFVLRAVCTIFAVYFGENWSSSLPICCVNNIQSFFTYIG